MRNLEDASLGNYLSPGQGGGTRFYECNILKYNLKAIYAPYFLQIEKLI